MTKCLFCDNIIEDFDINITICGSLECEYKNRTSYNNDNYLYEYIFNNKKEAKFLLTLAKKAINSDDYDILYNPVPHLPYGMSIEELEDIFNKDINIKNDIKKILELKNDQEIYNYFGEIKYCLYKFTLKSNLLKIKKNNLFNIDHFNIYEINHYEGKIETFNKEIDKYGYYYLYHGSDINNWYSILMNGLKLFSKTTRMLHGKNHNNRIYLSTSISDVIIYSNYPEFVVGVFKVIGNNILYDNNDHFTCIVKDVSTLCLSHLIHSTNNNLNKDEINAIDKMFASDIIKIEKEKKEYKSNMRNKRITSEILKVKNENINQFGLVFDINEENMYIWKVYITNIDNKCDLYNDMQIYNIKQIELEIRFEENYPILAPFIRVVYPIFKYKTGNITIGGSICMELLSNKYWDPAYCIENVIIQIKANILESGRIDPDKLNTKYTYEDSQITFKRMLLSHNWN